MYYADLEFRPTDSGVVLVKCTQKKGSLKLPAFVDGKPLMEIASIGQNPYIREIFIPDTVTSIGGMAFSGCPNLSFIHGSEDAIKEQGLSTLGENVSYIGECAFRGTGIRDLLIHGKSVTIGDGALRRCHHLRSVLLPQCNDLKLGQAVFKDSAITDFIAPHVHVQLLPEKTFAGCHRFRNYCVLGTEELAKDALLNCCSIQQINLTGLERIYTPPFAGCEHLLYVTLPESLLYCNAHGFLGSSIEHLVIEGKNEFYETIDGILYNKEQEQSLMLVACPPGKSGTLIPEKNVVTICERAFYNSRIKHVKLDHVRSICDEAFAFSELTEISLPSNLHHFGAGVFKGCNYLEALDLPSNIHIDLEDTFQGAPVTNIQYRGTVQDYNHFITGELIEENVSLTLLGEDGHFYEKSENFQTILYSGKIYGNHAKIEKIHDEYVTELDLPPCTDDRKPITVLGAGAVGSNLQKLYLPDTLEQIENDAFRYASSLTFLSYSSRTKFDESELPMGCHTVCRHE